MLNDILDLASIDTGSLELMPEILGDEQTLAPPGDADALADRIIQLLNDRGKRMELGARNKARAREHFSVEAMIEGYGGIYESVLSSS